MKESFIEINFVIAMLKMKLIKPFFFSKIKKIENRNEKIVNSNIITVIEGGAV